LSQTKGGTLNRGLTERVEHGESLPEVRATVAIPGEKAGFWRNWWAFVGPALLVSVGYMDPGNWSTDISAGAEFKYGLLWVVAVSSCMAIILQISAAKLGIVTGKDLARASRDYLPAWTRFPNWLTTEVAIAACDLAEVLGSALAIHLLFPPISILAGVFITALDVMIVMGLQGLGFRKIESFILVLVLTIAGCYGMELFYFGHAHREAEAIGQALLAPGFPLDAAGRRTSSLLLAIAIIGATVMPHNLYLHSALVQTRKLQRDPPTVRRAIRFNVVDSVVALALAFLVNASILVLAAITFFGKSDLFIPGTNIPLKEDWIQGAYYTMSGLLGASGASVLFALALLASGQSSTVTGTLAGQVVMEGFMNWRMRPWLRRMITRLAAIVPAVLVIAIKGDRETTTLLNISQFILGMQLPLAMVPLMLFTCRRKIMGDFVNGWFLTLAGWTSALLITTLDVYLLASTLLGH
jgi:manganese transport protein